MNILPKKKWHVRTKENMARVRRDEAKAAEEQKRIDERAAQAEHEDRIRRLQKKAADREHSMFDVEPSSEPSASTSVDASGHVNFFADLEKRETQNTTTGNKELEAEKKKERDEWETKMGILTYLGGNTNELMKQKSWYEQPFQRDFETASREKEKKEKSVISKLKTKETEKKKRKSSESEERSRKKSKKEKKKKRRHRSPSTDSEDEEEKKKRLQKLREERIRREQEERRRTEKMLNPTPVKKEPAVDKPKFERMYSSQFNPEFARQNYSRDK